MTSTEVVVAFIVAVVGGSGLPVYFLTRFDRRNTSQHAENKSVLTAMQSDLADVKTNLADVKSDTSEVKSNLINHLQHHLETDQYGFTRRTGT